MALKNYSHQTSNFSAYVSRPENGSQCLSSLISLVQIPQIPCPPAKPDYSLLSTFDVNFISDLPVLSA